MMPSTEYLQRLSLNILLCFSISQCSNKSTPENKGSDHIQILNEIPAHVQGVENLAIFHGNSEPLYSIDLIPEQTYGETGEPYLTKILETVVDDKGRVIVWDNNIYSREFPYFERLYVYHVDGTYHIQIGGPGKGPGEYGVVSNLQASAGKVFIYDITNRRLNVYTTKDFSLERSTPIERWSIMDHEMVQGMGFGGIKARNDGNLIAIFNERISDTGRAKHKYLLVDIDGNVLDYEPFVIPSTLKVTRSNSLVPSSLIWLPFMGHYITALSDKDALYTVWTQDFLIKKYDANGGYQSAIYYPVIGSPFALDIYTQTARYSQSEVMNTLEKFDEELPESKPIIADLKVDDENRVWVAVPAGQQREKYEWWILKESGELLAKLLLPREQPIYEIKDGYLYSKETNEETGAEFVVKYRIELTEK